MLCFDLFGDNTIDVAFCEEIIYFTPDIADGVRLSAIVAVKPLGDATQCLTLVHPRAFAEYEMASLADWLDDDGPVPFSHIFQRIRPNRASIVPDGEFSLQFAKGTKLAKHMHSRKLSGRLLTMESEGVDCRETLTAQDDFPDLHAPFNCLEVSIPARSGGYSLFRIDCHIPPGTLTDLIEQHETPCMRIYKVYGPDYVHRFIREVFLPKARNAHGPTTYRRHAGYLKALDVGTRLLPGVYSIVSASHGYTQEDPVTCLDLTDDLLDLSSSIDEGVYDDEALSRSSDRLHWFATKGPSKSFFLQLLAPIPALLNVGEELGG